LSATSPSLKQDFLRCPLCAESIEQSRTCHVGDCSGHPLYVRELPSQLHWLQCGICGHVYTKDYWTEAGELLIFSNAHAYQLPAPQQSEHLRNLWASTVHRVAERLAASRNHARVFGATRDARPTWLDVGFGSGGLVMVAEEFGFSAIGVDVRERAVDLLNACGYRALCAHFEHLELERPVAVLSMCDVLEHLRDPVAGLRKASALLEDRGLLYISCPNSTTSTWKQWEQAGTNPYWGELEHYHNFSRDSLVALLDREGFDVVDYYVSARYYSCMEVVATKRRQGPDSHPAG